MPDKFIEKQSKYWDSYNKGVGTIDLVDIPRAEKIELEFLSQLVGDLSGKTLLDLGCGTGKFGLKFAASAREVVGVDISKNTIEIANNTAEKYEINNFRGLLDDFKSNRYQDYFDVALAINVLHHTDDADVILGNVYRSLKKGGKLIVFEVNPLNLLFIPFLISCGQIWSHLTKQYVRSNIFSLKKLIESGGFRITKVNKWCLLPTVLYNRSLTYKRLNETLNKVPLIKAFCAFHVITCQKTNSGRLVTS